MKSLPLLLAATISAETAIPHHKALPHVEQELKIVMPSTQNGVSLANKRSEEPLGRVWGRILYRNQLWANKFKRQMSGPWDAYVDTASEIHKTYPDLKMWQRHQLYGCLKSRIKSTLLRSRGCKDYRTALPMIAKALGIPLRKPSASYL